MHILMIAPEPFFEPRGTPFSEFHRIRALTSLGHTVDLVTYPFGRDVDLPGLRIHRCARPPFVSRVKIGPSWAKVPLNLSLTLTAARLAMTRKFDAVHSHEEGGGIGVLLAAMLRIPHLYDMHSSLPQQVKNFGVRGVPGLSYVLGWLERLMVVRSRVVIVICEDLRTTVHGIRPDVPTVLIENAPGSGTVPIAGSGARIRAALGLDADAPVALYTGTFEAYQGLDLLFAAMAILVEARPDARLVLVGGDETQVATVRRQAHAAGLAPYVVLTGQRPAEEIPAYLDAATILVSPRSIGTNTPLKIYQYLRSGRPIVATNLRTHTQVLSSEIAFLGDATPSGYAGAMLAALSDPDRARRIGEEARRVADARYNDDAYVAKTRHALDLLFDAPASEVGRSVA